MQHELKYFDSVCFLRVSFKQQHQQNNAYSQTRKMDSLGHSDRLRIVGLCWAEIARQSSSVLMHIKLSLHLRWPM